MNSLETTVVLWAICSILLFEILILICICRCCFNRMKPTRFYVKREEYEYATNISGTQSYLQPTILRPPHADELALIGTLRTPHPTFNPDNGVDNFAFYRDRLDTDDHNFIMENQLLKTQHTLRPDWERLKISSNFPMNTENSLSSKHENKLNKLSDMVSSAINMDTPSIEYDHELENFQITSPNGQTNDNSFSQRKDTSTESFTGQNLILEPKSILKGITSNTSPLHTNSLSHSSKCHDYISTKSDLSPSTSIKINTFNSGYLESVIDSFEKFNLPPPTFTNPTSSLSLFELSDQMRFASVSRLNEIQWEIPNEFQPALYDFADDDRNYRSAIIYRSNQDLNLRANDRFTKKSNSAETPLNVSRIFIPWQEDFVSTKMNHSSDDRTLRSMAQQQAFEY